MTVVDGAWGTCHLPVLQTCQQGILRAFHLSRLNFSGSKGALDNLFVFVMPRGASSAKRLSAKLATSNHSKESKMSRQRLGVACDLTRNNCAAGEMGRALQKKQQLSSMISKLFLLLFLQPQIHGYKPHAVRLAHL